MIAAWQRLGIEIEHDKHTCELRVVGCGGSLPVDKAELFIANSGTTIRFLTAALATCRGTFQLDGVPRMHERPIGDLLDALRQLGAEVKSLNENRGDCPPVQLNALGLEGGTVTIAGNISSQYLSGLMMASPMAKGDVTLVVEGELVSVPYVEMTTNVMQSFGASVSGPSTGPLKVSSNKRYVATDYDIEPDASAASYFWAAAAITGGVARVHGLSSDSLQGDVRFCDVLREMGCDVCYGQDFIEVRRTERLVGIDVDMADISDTVQTLAAVAIFAEGPTTVRGVAHNRVKETDRISDLATELRRLGADVDEFHDGMKITPPSEISPARIHTYHDHRMAMSLALVGLKAEGVEILDPECTSKTYPHYWEDMSLFASAHIQRLD